MTHDSGRNEANTSMTNFTTNANYTVRVWANDTSGNSNTSSVHQFTVSSPGGWWDSNWQYRVKIPVEPSTDGEQTNYQMMITVHNGSGTNSVGHVYCNQHCRADFGDIRFTDEYNTELDYWIEDKTDSDNAIIWVEIPIIPSSGVTKYYMYYGKDFIHT